MVYSTCSLNPIEDEAVVAAALANFNGEVKLVAGPAVGHATYSIAAPRGEMYSGGRPGLSTWTVSPPGDAATHIDKYEDTPDQYKKKMLSSKPYCHPLFSILLSGMWPPTDESIKAQLHHCRRFFPHDINAGGFFVAAFEKVSNDAVDSNEESAATDKHAPEQRRGGRPAAVDGTIIMLHACAHRHHHHHHLIQPSPSVRSTIHARKSPWIPYESSMVSLRICCLASYSGVGRISLRRCSFSVRQRLSNIHTPF